MRVGKIAEPVWKRAVLPFITSYQEIPADMPGRGNGCAQPGPLHQAGDGSAQPACLPDGGETPGRAAPDVETPGRAAPDQTPGRAAPGRETPGRAAPGGEAPARNRRPFRESGMETAGFVFTVDTLCLKGYGIRKNGICRTVNHIAAAGARPAAVLADVLLPKDAEEDQLKMLMQQLSQLAEQQRIVIAGGNTLVLEDVVRPVVTLTGIGRKLPLSGAGSGQPGAASGAGFAQPGSASGAESGQPGSAFGAESVKLKPMSGAGSAYGAESVKLKPMSGAGVSPGMDIIVSKWIGLEGSVLLLEEERDRLQQKFSAPFLEEAQELSRYLSVLDEAALAAQSGVGAMHDVSEGGIFGALWELAEGFGVGLDIDLKKIPIRQQTVEICEALDVNPYVLLSGGSLLMAAYDGYGLVERLKREGISAAVIGKATAGRRRTCYNDGEIRYLERPCQDEWYRFLENRA